MKYITGTPLNESYKIAVAVEELKMDVLSGVKKEALPHTIAIETHEASVTLHDLKNLQAEYLITSSERLFKKLTKKTRVYGWLNTPVPCTSKGFEFLTVLYSPAELIVDNVHRANSIRLGKYEEPTCPVKDIQLNTLPEIKQYLRDVVTRKLSCDVETFSLKHYDAGIGSIALSEDQGSGTSFLVDLREDPEEAKILRAWLKEFFERREKLGITTMYHNAGFDVQILIYQLWMKGLADRKNLLKGLKIMTSFFEDTKILAYLATNSTKRVPIDLKSLAEEYMGTWSKADIKDIRKIPPNELMEYNARDAAATWYVWNKFKPAVIKDKQMDLYQEFKKYLIDIIQMQLTGIPFVMHRAKRVTKYLQAFSDKAKNKVLSSEAVKASQEALALKWVEKRNATLKKKRVTAEDYKDEFNLNSGVHLRTMLYEILNFPILSRTESGLPSTDKDTLKTLRNHTEDESVIGLLNAINDFTDADKLLSTFMPPLLATPMAEDGWHYLYGNFNLGGTVSGRLSSSGPNLQNLPSSGARFSKVFKYIFKAPPGYLLVGADFASLEDRISALITKDPAKLKVYEDSYDGHSLRAYYYFKEQMPDIDPDSVDSINSIAHKYPKLRQASKAPTFLLTYGGSWMGLMTNCGFDKDTALKIEANYHDLYKVSDEVIAERLKQASKVGYAEVAFGLRVRTPSLASNQFGPHVEGDKRTVGNAMGQSYGLLNSRAVQALMVKARMSNLHVSPCAQIHDASYYIIKDDGPTLEWINKHLPHEMAWQQLEDIKHPTVGLGGSLSVFKKSWGKEVTLPANASRREIDYLLKNS